MKEKRHEYIIGLKNMFPLKKYEKNELKLFPQIIVIFEVGGCYAIHAYMSSIFQCSTIKVSWLIAFTAINGLFDDIQIHDFFLAFVGFRLLDYDTI